MLKPEHQAAVDKYLSTDHKGKAIDKKALLKPNQMIGKALMARMMSMTDEQRQAIKGILTPQTADALKILLPELGKLIDQGVAGGTAAG